VEAPDSVGVPAAAGVFRQLGPDGLRAGWRAEMGRGIGPGCGMGQAGLRPVKQQRSGGRVEGASVDFGDLGRKRLWAEKGRRKEIPFYFQKTFS
jgi:hypothetical protein